MKIEFVPRDHAIWQPEKAYTYRCPHCQRPVFTQHEGPEIPQIECRPDGHKVSWETLH